MTDDDLILAREVGLGIEPPRFRGFQVELEGQRVNPWWHDRHQQSRAFSDAFVTPQNHLVLVVDRITRQQLGGTNSFDDLILLFFVPDGVVTQDAANEPTIGAPKLARVGPSAQHAKQQRQLMVLPEKLQNDGKIGL